MEDARNISTLSELFALTKSKLENQTGTISINFANKSYIYKGRDIIGNCLQEWLPSWFSYLNLDVARGEHSQAFPDFVLTLNGISYDIEVKAWNYKCNPGFDLANFQSFLATTYESPNKLDAWYFVMGYELLDDGFSEGFVVKEVFLKKIWEMTAPMKKYPIGIQVKRNVVYALRPNNFARHPEKCFSNREEFIEAIYQTFCQFPATGLQFTPEEWKQAVVGHYKNKVAVEKTSE